MSCPKKLRNQKKENPVTSPNLRRQKPRRLSNQETISNRECSSTKILNEFEMYKTWCENNKLILKFPLLNNFGVCEYNNVLKSKVI